MLSNQRVLTVESQSSSILLTFNSLNDFFWNLFCSLKNKTVQTMGANRNKINSIPQNLWKRISLILFYKFLVWTGVYTAHLLRTFWNLWTKKMSLICCLDTRKQKCTLPKSYSLINYRISVNRPTTNSKWMPSSLCATTGRRQLILLEFMRFKIYNPQFTVITLLVKNILNLFRLTLKFKHGYTN